MDSKNKNSQSAGFTLIELLVAMTIFSVVAVSVIDVFLISLSATRKVFNQQGILDSGRFVLESISKELRMSQIETPAGGPFTAINIINSKGESVRYSFNQECDSTGCLTPSKVDMTGSFYVQEGSGTLFMPPRVTIIMTITNKEALAGEQAVIHLQTTVSSREYAQ
jgi:prepilin-type N-terminal cleavage/methylation domain-containing protein